MGVYDNINGTMVRIAPNIRVQNSPVEQYVTEAELVEGLSTKQDKTSEITFNDLQMLKTSDVDNGTYVNLLSNKTKYLVTDNPSTTTESIFVVALDNGLYAEVVCTPNTILNVLLNDIVPNNNISTKLNELITLAVEKGVKGIEFNEGTYIIDDTVYLKSLVYVGIEGKTVLSVAKTFNAERVFITVFDSQWQTDVFDIEMYGLKFYFGTCSDHTWGSENAIILMSLRNMKHCILDGCTFEASPTEENGAYMRVTLLWFKDNIKCENITIKNCKFYENVGLGCTQEQYAQDFLPGGGVFFKGKDSTITSKNIFIDNCEFSSTTSDEVLSFWTGNFEDVTISNCKFAILENGHINNNVLTMYNGNFYNCQVVDSDFTLNNLSKRTLKIMSINENSYISLKELSFTTNYELESRPSSSNQIQGFINYLNTISTSSFVGINNVNIVDCVFKINKKSYGNSAISLEGYGANIVINECDVDFDIDTTEKNTFYWGILKLSCNNSGLNVLLNNNKIKSDVNLCAFQNSVNTNVVFDSNILSNAITNHFGTIANNNTLTFINNYIDKLTDIGYVVYTNATTAPQNKLKVTLFNNNINPLSDVHNLLNNIFRGTSSSVIQNDYMELFTDLQVGTMPIASVIYENMIYQYVGTTNANYTHGYFYECVSDGQSTPTYSWVNVRVEDNIYVTPEMFGAVGDGITDDTQAFTNAINAARLNGKKLFLSKRYYLASKVTTNTWTTNLVIEGVQTDNTEGSDVGKSSSIIAPNGFEIISFVTLKNIMFDGYGIQVIGNKNHINNCMFKTCNKGIEMVGGYGTHSTSWYGETIIDSCYFYECPMGIDFILDNVSNKTYHDCIVRDNIFARNNIGINGYVNGTLIQNNHIYSTLCINLNGANNVVSENYLDGSGTLITMSSSSGNMIVHNNMFYKASIGVDANDKAYPVCTFSGSANAILTFNDNSINQLPDASHPELVFVKITDSGNLGVQYADNVCRFDFIDLGNGVPIVSEDSSITISLNDLQSVVAASSDFADFQTRIAAL